MPPENGHRPAISEGRLAETQSVNWVRHVPSETYFARIKVRGKLIRRALGTGQITVAKLRLGDLEKQEQQVAEVRDALRRGWMTVGEASGHPLAICPDDRFGELPDGRRRDPT